MADQLKDDGAVIGYQPNLEYKKELNNKADSGNKKPESASSSHDGVEYSSTLNSLANNLPSTALSNIDFVLDNLKMLIDQLSKSFVDGEWNKYNNISSLISAIESNNEEYIDEFINFHFHNITGSIVPELIGNINAEKVRLELLSVTLKKLYYNDSNLTTDEAVEKDKGYLQQLRTYETAGEDSKINYLVISQDAILNRSVSTFAFDVNEECINLSEVVTNKDESTANPSKTSLVKKLFEEVNDELTYRKDSYDDKQMLDIMTKTLYNYYSKRKDLNELYSLMNLSKDSIFLGRKVVDYKNRLNESLINVNRVFSGNGHHVSELTSLEQEKAFLMNIYSTFNYNSEN